MMVGQIFSDVRIYIFKSFMLVANLLFCFYF